MPRRLAWILLVGLSIHLVIAPELAGSNQFVLASTEEGPVTKTLKIESEPPGADVLLKQGTREVKLGTTPLSHEAEFHSKISILRMVFRKKGYESRTLEVSATQDSVLAKLAVVEIVVSPGLHEDPKLKTLQSRINPILLKIVPGLLAQESPFELELPTPLRLMDVEGKTLLMVTFILGGAKGLPIGGGKEGQQALLKKLWGHLGSQLVLPLAAALRGEKDISSIVLQLVLNEPRIQFGVTPRMETTVEMECQPGYVYYPGYSYPIYNPCARREAVTKTEVKLEPKTEFVKEKVRIQYVVPFLLLDKHTDPEQLYDKIGVSLTDAKGPH
jgi:hypothetical protein